MAKAEEYLSQSKYAEHRKVTKEYITKLIKEGQLHLIKGKLNVAMSDAELDNKSNDDKAPNYWREKALHEKAKRKLAELDLKLKHDRTGFCRLLYAPFCGMVLLQNFGVFSTKKAEEPQKGIRLLIIRLGCQQVDTYTYTKILSITLGLCNPLLLDDQNKS